MKKAVTFSFLVFVFSGCTSPSITYMPYTNVVYPPKSKDSPLILEPSLLAKRQFTTIGHLTVKGRSWGSHYTSRHDIEKKFLSEALAKGADGVVDATIESAPYEYDSYVPGYTTYEPMTMYHSGNVSGTTSSTAYSSYGGTAWGSGSYHGHYFGTSTSNVPIYHEGFTVHHSGVIHTLSGNLIILLDKDTFGYIGVSFDMQAQNVNGARIWQIKEGSPAEIAGLKQGDILTKVNDIEITSTYDFFANVTPKVGEPIYATYLREGKEFTTELIPRKGCYNVPQDETKAK